MEGEEKMLPVEVAETMGNFYSALKGLWVQWHEARRSFPLITEHDARRYLRLSESALHRAMYYSGRASSAYFKIAIDQEDPHAIEEFNRRLAIIEEAWKESTSVTE